MNRRQFLVATGALATSSRLIPATHASSMPGRAWGRSTPAWFRTLYNNDSTNLLSCYSPWSNPSNNAHPEVFSQNLIEASVAEVAGLVDVQLFCPGLCWVPWWKSEFFPAPANYLWYYELIEKPAGPYDAYARYMLGGGDMVAGFLQACRRRGQTAFVSFRLNDVQFLETKNGAVVLTSDMSKFWYDHSTYGSGDLYTLGTDYLNSPQRAQNWAIPEVRAYKLNLLKEICRYDIDGLELDFNRYANFFPPGSDVASNVAIMVDFVKQVRAALDLGPDPPPPPPDTASASFYRPRYRYLCVRVPSFLDVHPKLGISLPQFVQAGVDMVNVSDGYFTTIESDLALIRASVPETKIYFETTQTTNFNADYPDGSRPFLRTTDQQFHTAANAAYRKGADGISVFNFAYYRQTSNEIASDPGVGPFNEPPFHVLKNLRDPDYVASRPRWYVLAVDHDSYISPSMQMPQILNAGESTTFKLFMYPEGKNADAILRVRLWVPDGYAGGPVPDWAPVVGLNGTQLNTIPYTEAPLFDPYRANLAVDPTRFRCFAANSALAIEGQNLIKVTLTQPTPEYAGKVTLDYLDISWP